MSYSLSVLVVNQNEVKKPTMKSPIKIISEFEGDGRFHYTWPFTGSINGILYELWIEEEDGFYTAFPLIDTDFEVLDSQALPPWIEDEVAKEMLTKLWAKEKYKKELFRLLRKFKNLSPDKTLMIHTRYQGGDAEIIQGVLNLETYLSMLDKGTALFNVCYITRN